MSIVLYKSLQTSKSSTATSLLAIRPICTNSSWWSELGFVATIRIKPNCWSSIFLTNLSLLPLSSPSVSCSRRRKASSSSSFSTSKCFLRCKYQTTVSNNKIQRATTPTKKVRSFCFSSCRFIFCCWSNNCTFPFWAITRWSRIKLLYNRFEKNATSRIVKERLSI